jgi:hypothetical protein
MPDPTAVDAFAVATRRCQGLTTMTSELRLSGRAGGERIRGTLHAGLAAPASIRFEAVAPFGRPFFILAGRDDTATLLFPRDNRVLPDASVPDLLERLTGLDLTAGDVRLILTACLVDSATPTEGRTWPGGWRGVSLGADRLAYLRNVNGVPAIVAADHGAWRIDYADHQQGWPRRVRIRGGDGAIDVTAAIDQLAVNTTLHDDVFAITIPPGADRMTLQDLRAVAPLRGSD